MDLIKLTRPQIDTLGLAAYYKLWAGFKSAGTVFDYSLNGNDGIVTGATPAYPGFLFDGVDDRIAIADSDSIEVIAITMIGWIKLDSTWSNVGYLIAKMDDVAMGGELAYGLFVAGDKTLRTIISSDGNITTSEGSTSQISEEKWHQVAGTYEFSNELPVYKLYVDGVLVASDGGGNATGPIYNTGTGRLTLGARFDASDAGYSFFVNGFLDDLRIYNVIKNTAQIRSDFEITRGRYGV